MRVIAPILGLLGGVAGLLIWVSLMMVICCAFPPEYRKPISGLMSTLYGTVAPIATLLSPVSAVFGIICGGLLLAPRFRLQKVVQAEIICVAGLMLSLAIYSLFRFEPYDGGQAFLRLLIGTLPGVLVIVSGWLANVGQGQHAPEPLTQ